MYQGSCLCQKVSWEMTAPIESITACNCSACRRYGVLWAYGHEGVDIEVKGETSVYHRAGKYLGFHFCSTCGCVVSWRAVNPSSDGKVRMAVNTRLILDPAPIANLPIDHFDGLVSFEDLPRDERCVKDMWF